MINSMQVMDLPSFEGRLITEEDKPIIAEMIAGDPLFPSLDSLDPNTDFTANVYATSRIFKRKSDGVDVAWALSHRTGGLLLLSKVVVHPNYRRQGILTTLRREHEQFVKSNFTSEIDTLGVHYLSERVKSGNTFDSTNTDRATNKPYKELFKNREEGHATVLEMINTEDL